MATAPSAILPPLPTLTILGHPNLQRVGDRVLLGELITHRDFQLSRRSPEFLAPGAHTGDPLEDRFLSRRPVFFRGAASGGISLYRGNSATELLIDGEPLHQERHLPARALDQGVVLELARRVVLLLHRHRAHCDEADDGCGMIGASASLAKVRASIDRLAAFDVPVLIRGESGTGKELVARALHHQGLRRQAPFLDVSLPAVPTSLAAAELFGVTKGAYTGANRDRRGYFERAHGGTLFLDEVGEAAVELQVLLLRALETGKIWPSGSSQPRQVDVRVLSATDANLEELSRIGRFCLPLLHRLAGYSIHLPPLRRRRDDIGRLLVHFLLRELRKLGGELPDTSEAPRP